MLVNSYSCPTAEAIGNSWHYRNRDRCGISCIFSIDIDLLTEKSQYERPVICLWVVGVLLRDSHITRFWEEHFWRLEPFRSKGELSVEGELRATGLE